LEVTVATFFQDHKQRRPQWQARRRNGAVPTGTTVIHTYEAPAGRTARAGADYFLVRDNPASYHYLADALGNRLHLAPWSGEAWHDTSSNNWSVGISMMTRAADWPKLTPEQRDNLVNGAAMGAHLYSRWLVSQGKAPIPARRINRAAAMRREAGFVTHGDMDPGRRSDPGEHFPWEQFLNEFRRLEAGKDPAPAEPAPPTSTEDDMNILVSDKYPNGVLFAGGGISELRGNVGELDNLIKAGVKRINVTDLVLTELIQSARGKYTNVATRQG
jgi:hypothetical protein